MKIKILLIAILVFVGSTTMAQPPAALSSSGNMGTRTGSISGSIKDELTGAKMEYTNVVLYKQMDSSLVTGTVTNMEGFFKLDKIAFGKYYLKVKFLGYNEKTINDIKVNPKNPVVDLGNIKLSPASTNIDDVEVIAEQSPVMYKLDKKIVTVSSNLNNSGGTAVEVLENTPSVQVDIEGNVSLRGSSNFTVLIDGRPSPFSGSDALEQIPAGSIEKIEIITNPSAKYDPDGTAGIINVISKKRSLEGTSGMINLNADNKGSYGGDVIFNMKKEKISYSLGANLRSSERNGYREQDQWSRVDDTTYHTYSEGDREGGRSSASVKAGIDYSITKRDLLAVNVSTGSSGFERKAVSDYREWTEPESQTLDRISKDYMDRNSNFVRANIDYTHNFDESGHNIKASAFYKTDKSDSEDGTDLLSTENILQEGLKSFEDGTGTDYRFNVDYTLPFSEDGKFEAGWQTRIKEEVEEYGVYKRVMPGGTFSTDAEDATESKYDRLIHAVYSIYGNEWRGFGYQIGLRGEYTRRDLENAATAEVFTIDRWDYFPSAHFSYQLPADQQLMTSYSRRIDRPRGYWLEPFQTYRDAYTIWEGNPSLKPEYINSMELSYKKQFGPSFFSVEAFYRNTKNKVERIRSVYSEDVMLHTVANVGEDFAKGLELMLNVKVNKLYSFNLMGSAFDYSYKIDSDLLDSEDPGHSTNWNINLKNTFRLGKKFKVQLDGRYNGPSVTAQGTREGYFMTSSAIRADFFDNKLTATLQFRDMFATGKHEFEAEGADFYSKTLFERNPQVLKLSLSYKINNYREKRGRSNDGMEMDGGEDF